MKIKKAAALLLGLFGKEMSLRMKLTKYFKSMLWKKRIKCCPGSQGKSHCILWRTSLL